MTDAEIMLWQKLRKRQICSCKFRKQSPIGRYIVDFVCNKKKLIIEIDGGQHAENEEYDKQRTEWLESQGYTVVRFWNTDVLQNIDGVLESLISHLQIPPHSDLPNKKTKEGEGT